MQVHNYQESLDYLQDLALQPNSQFPTEYGTRQSKELLARLGNPQEKLKIVHIAGTSGKGSTAYLISHLLKESGFQVGLQLSPHLLDIRERIQINEEWISQAHFLAGMQTLLPAIAQMTKPPSFFEIITALAFLTFVEQKVEYAIIETGLGGLHDATNVIERSDKLSIITKIGYDHMNKLGHHLSEIARQKAGIFPLQGQALSCQQAPEVSQTLAEVAEEKKCQLTFVPFTNPLHCDLEGCRFNFIYQDWQLKNLSLSLLGAHQIENASLALAALWHLEKRDHLKIHPANVRKALGGARFAGRLQLLKGFLVPLILDGAHNPQKMEALLSSLITLFPGQKYTFLLAFKENKESTKILDQLLPFADYFYLTTFSATDQGLPFQSQDPEQLATYLEQKKFKQYQVIESPSTAFNRALKEGKNPLIVSGSLYLLSSLYPLLKLNKA